MIGLKSKFIKILSTILVIVGNVFIILLWRMNLGYIPLVLHYSNTYGDLTTSLYNILNLNYIFIGLFVFNFLCIYLFKKNVVFLNFLHLFLISFSSFYLLFCFFVFYFNL